jgi:GNAT superfamily N-acetyltransferase
MTTISLRPVEIERDFGQLAALFALEQGEPTTAASLKEDYERHKDHIIRLMAAENEKGEMLGFNWLVRNRTNPAEIDFYLIINPEQRGQGAGGKLYEDLEQVAKAEGVKRMQIRVRDDCPRCRKFADQRKFTLQRHSMAMALNLEKFNDQPYNEVLDRLKSEGFHFTTMEALGNTEETQRKLYALNDSAAAETPGSIGVHPWVSFEDFQKEVCQSNWYKPSGQFIAIDTQTNLWAGMSAITRFEGMDYAYNLFTGVDQRYRGRKLGQAVKTLALRYARDVLQVKKVQTHHNTVNNPIIAIDRKFGYVQIPGYYVMEKMLA